MARLRQLACLLLAALWLPATLHCDFEAVGFGELFHCDSAQHAPADHQTCGDACAVLESGWIKRATSEIALAAPVTLCLCLISPACDSAAPARPVAETLVDRAAPPELARTWQFVTRTAPPPRAPSLAS